MCECGRGVKAKCSGKAGQAVVRPATPHQNERFLQACGPTEVPACPALRAGCLKRPRVQVTSPSGQQHRFKAGGGSQCQTNANSLHYLRLHPSKPLLLAHCDSISHPCFAPVATPAVSALAPTIMTLMSTQLVPLKKLLPVIAAAVALTSTAYTSAHAAWPVPATMDASWKAAEEEAYLHKVGPSPASLSRPHGLRHPQSMPR